MRNMKKNNCCGRSMVEMLAVLAIVGVLSIGGLTLYYLATRHHQANEILDDVRSYAGDIIFRNQTYAVNQEIPPRDFEKAQKIANTMNAWQRTDDVFGVVVQDVDSSTCRVTLNKADGAYPMRVSKNGVDWYDWSGNNETICDNDGNTVAIEFLFTADAAKLIASARMETVDTTNHAIENKGDDDVDEKDASTTTKPSDDDASDDDDTSNTDTISCLSENESETCCLRKGKKENLKCTYTNKTCTCVNVKEQIKKCQETECHSWNGSSCVFDATAISAERKGQCLKCDSVADKAVDVGGRNEKYAECYTCVNGKWEQGADTTKNCCNFLNREWNSSNNTCCPTGTKYAEKTKACCAVDNGWAIVDGECVTANLNRTGCNECYQRQFGRLGCYPIDAASANESCCATLYGSTHEWHQGACREKCDGHWYEALEGGQYVSWACCPNDRWAEVGRDGDGECCSSDKIISNGHCCPQHFLWNNDANRCVLEAMSTVVCNECEENINGLCQTIPASKTTQACCASSYGTTHEWYQGACREKCDGHWYEAQEGGQYVAWACCPNSKWASEGQDGNGECCSSDKIVSNGHCCTQGFFWNGEKCALPCNACQDYDSQAGQCVDKAAENITTEACCNNLYGATHEFYAGACIERCNACETRDVTGLCINKEAEDTNRTCCASLYADTHEWVNGVCVAKCDTCQERNGQTGRCENTYATQACCAQNRGAEYWAATEGTGTCCAESEIVSYGHCCPVDFIWLDGFGCKPKCPACTIRFPDGECKKTYTSEECCTQNRGAEYWAATEGMCCTTESVDGHCCNVVDWNTYLHHDIRWAEQSHKCCPAEQTTASGYCCLNIINEDCCKLQGENYELVHIAGQAQCREKCGACQDRDETGTCVNKSVNEVNVMCCASLYASTHEWYQGACREKCDGRWYEAQEGGQYIAWACCPNDKWAAADNDGNGSCCLGNNKIISEGHCCSEGFVWNATKNQCVMKCPADRWIEETGTCCNEGSKAVGNVCCASDIDSDVCCAGLHNDSYTLRIYTARTATYKFCVPKCATCQKFKYTNPTTMTNAKMCVADASQAQSSQVCCETSGRKWASKEASGKQCCSSGQIVKNGLCFEQATNGICRVRGQTTLLNCTDSRVVSGEFCRGPYAGKIKHKSGMNTIKSKCESVGASPVKPEEVCGCDAYVIGEYLTLYNRHNDNICVVHPNDGYEKACKLCGKHRHEEKSKTNHPILCRKN